MRAKECGYGVPRINGKLLVEWVNSGARQQANKDPHTYHETPDGIDSLPPNTRPTAIRGIMWTPAIRPWLGSA